MKRSCHLDSDSAGAALKMAFVAVVTLPRSFRRALDAIDAQGAVADAIIERRDGLDDMLVGTARDWSKGLNP